MIFGKATEGLFETQPGVHTPMPAVPVEDGWFAEPVCRNCTAPLDTPYCPQCGQKAAKRLVWRDIGKETWDRWRLFEIKSLRTVGRLVWAPGRVAREYVLGRRAAHMHPLTLLVALVTLLVLELAANNYFGLYGFAGRDADVDRMAQRVLAYANWSFSLGIFAIFAGSWSVFRRRLGYNFVEHAVLSVFCQNLILAVILVNMLPTLLWPAPSFILWHKGVSGYAIPAIKLLIVAIAYKQFFLLDLRRDWWRLALACLIYVGINWLLLRIYALAIFWIVTATM